MTTERFKHVSVEALAYREDGDAEPSHGAALVTVHNEDECEACAAMAEMIREFEAQSLAAERDD